MAKRYLLAEDTIDATDREELIAWLRGNPRLTHGDLVRAFETEWSRWLGVPHSVFVSSGSSANLLAYYGLLVSGRLWNRKVVVPAVSWATTVAPALQLGFEPVMCDADPDTLGLDPDGLEGLLREHRPALVVLVHTLGVPAKMDAIMALKERYGFVLLEDACAAHGSRYDDRKVGTFGEASTFSFYFGHHISTIEGGMVSTNDPSLDAIFRMIRAHGWAKDISPEIEVRLARRHGVIDFNRRFTFYYPGFNLRSTDLNARIGLSQLKKIDRVVARRNENDCVYRQRFLNPSSGFHIQVNPRAFISSISFVAIARNRDHRARIAAALEQAGVETRPLGGGNMSRQPFWASRYGVTSFPVADRLHEAAFHLPNHPGLTVEDIGHICDVTQGVSA